MAFNYGTNTGSGGGFWNMSNFTNLGSKYWDPKPGLASVLGRTGAAISPQDSWQQRLGATAADIAQKEQGRRYLAELLAGNLERDGMVQEGEDKDSKEEGEEESSDLAGGLLESDALGPRYGDLSKTPIGLDLSRYLDPTQPVGEKDITPYGGTIRR